MVKIYAKERLHTREESYLRRLFLDVHAIVWASFWLGFSAHPRSSPSVSLFASIRGASSSANFPLGVILFIRRCEFQVNMRCCRRRPAAPAAHSLVTERTNELGYVMTFLTASEHCSAQRVCRQWRGVALRPASWGRSVQLTLNRNAAHDEGLAAWLASPAAVAQLPLVVTATIRGGKWPDETPGLGDSIVLAIKAATRTQAQAAREWANEERHTLDVHALLRNLVATVGGRLRSLVLRDINCPFGGTDLIQQVLAEYKRQFPQGQWRLNSEWLALLRAQSLIGRSGGSPATRTTRVARRALPLVCASTAPTA